MAEPKAYTLWWNRRWTGWAVVTATLGGDVAGAFGPQALIRQTAITGPAKRVMDEIMTSCSAMKWESRGPWPWLRQ